MSDTPPPVSTPPSSAPSSSPLPPEPPLVSSERVHPLARGRRALLVWLLLGLLLLASAYRLLVAPGPHTVAGAAQPGAGAGAVSELAQAEGETMGTTYTVKWVLPGGVDGPAADSAALSSRFQQTLDRVNKAMSTYDPESELSRFNRSATTQPVPVSAALFTVLAAAEQVSEATGGAFDATVGALVSAWGFGAGGGSKVGRDGKGPSQQALAAMQAYVGHALLTLDPKTQTVRKGHPKLTVDLSAIAKGYGVDQLAGVLDAAGVGRYMVEVGGEVRAQGLSHRGEPWRLGVEQPAAGRHRRPFMVVGLRGHGMATSGNYRNFRRLNQGQDAVVVGHTLDPRTGRPAVSSRGSGGQVVSATVVHSKSAMIADAYATAMMVLGPQEGLAVADQQGLAVAFIVANAQGKLTTVHNDGFAALQLSQ